MKTTKTKRLFDKGELIFYIALIAIPLLQVAIFYFVVNFNSVLMAFKQYNKYDDTSIWNNGANFVRLWKEFAGSKTILTLLGNSIIVWLFTSVLGTFLSVLFSYYIFKKWLLHKTFKFILFLPTVLPSILLVLLYQFFVNEAIPQVMELITGNKADSLFNLPETMMPTVIFYNVWVCFGAQILIYSGAMDQISPDILEAGQVDGVTPVREFFSLVIPMILPTVATFFIASVATIFTNQANLYAFFGEIVLEKYQTIGYYLFCLVNKEGAGMSDYGYASAFGIVCTLIAFPLTMIAKRLLNGKGEEQ